MKYVVLELNYKSDMVEIGYKRDINTDVVSICDTIEEAYENSENYCQNRIAEMNKKHKAHNVKAVVQDLEYVTTKLNSRNSNKVMMMLMYAGTSVKTVIQVFIQEIK